MSLTTIIQAKQTELFNQYGVFFAFSNEQFEKGKKEGVIYSQLGAGMLCPKANVQAFWADHERVVADGIAEDIRANGKDAIIRRELYNYECFYTGDIDDCVDAVECYGFTRADVVAEYHKGGSEE